MKSTIYLTGLVFLVLSCGSAVEENLATQDGQDSLICIMPEPPRIGRATWLIGEWENNYEGGRMFESWEFAGDSLMSGLSYTIENGDTVAFETISLRQRGIDLFYIPTVNNQNEGEVVEFKLTIFTDSTLVFENPNHDFPQKISYINYGGDSLLAEISGIYEDEPAAIQFPMKRIK